ncbi:MAG: helix-turn-helix domain-containing protein [Clostridia bacterium]|jgi:DNA-binding protein Fis|nr:helix-turn-helix domain-containing protein [Clostridia bacterium]MCI2000650.1 helix-turn-helix domain-containing protein [Clostridia bacterium]MCI2015277.1 helix-turn-helix domain-containing protein [Clostridia bacterium]
MTTFEQILALEELKDAKVIAGKQGMNTPISWVHIVFDVDISSWISKGNLLIVNGAGFRYAERDLISIIEQLNQVKAAGIIVEKGKYINVISKKVIRKADELGILVIEVCRKLDMESLTYAIGQLCFKDSQMKNRSEILKEIVYLPYIEERRKELINLGYDENEPYAVAAIEPNLESVDSIKAKSEHFWTHIKDRFLSLVSSEFLTDESKLWHFNENGIYIYLVKLPQRDCAKKTIIDHMKNIKNNITNTEGGITVSIGIGNIIYDIKGIRASVYQAKYALSSLSLCKRSNEVRLYEDMGVYRIFFQYHNDEKLIELYKRILGELERQDKEYNSQMLDTLETYFTCNCNLSRTADVLFIHRNTLKYRLKKIKEILMIDFDDCNASFTVQFALKIKKYLKAQGTAVVT